MHKEKAIKKIRYVITTLVVFMAAIMGKSYFSVVEANAEETEHSAVYVESKGEDSISAVQVTSDNVAASEDKSSNVKTGWQKIDGKWYYYDSNSVLQKSKWINTNSKWYYVDKTGEMQTSKWINAKNKWYYVGKTGEMQTSKWINVKNKWYYVGKTGEMQTSKWINVKNKWYYVSKTGEMQTSKWINVNSKWYYVNKTGEMQTSKWISSTYYVKTDGSMAVSEWVDNNKYYVGEDGKWIKTVVKGQTIKFGIEPFKKAVPSTATKIHFISKKDMPADVAAKLNSQKGTDISSDNNGVIKVYAIGTEYYVVSITDEKMGPNNCPYMFMDYKISDIEFKNFDTSNVTNMSCMFAGCSELKELNISDFDTSKVRDMSDMFYSCSELIELYLGNFNTSNVTNMRNMFEKCSKLKELNLKRMPL